MTTTLTETTSHATAITDRQSNRALLAGTGALFAVLVVVGNAIYSEGGSEGLGYGIELLGYVALAVFLAWIAATLSTASRIAATLAVIGGGMMLAVKLVGYAVVMASKQAALSSDVATGLVQVDEFAFVIAWLPYGLLMVGLSLAAMHAGRLPQPVAWVGVALGAGCLLAVPLSSAEPFVLPWLISLLWLITASILLARGRGRGGQPWSVEV